MKKMVMLMVVILGINAFAADRDNGMDRDMRKLHMENQQNNREMISRESNTTLEQRTPEERDEWIHENMTRKSKGSGKNR